MAGDNRNIVYSTHSTPERTKEAEQKKPHPAAPSGGGVKIQREKKGRRGKTVTVIYGLKGDLRELQSELQKFCGTGGSSKNGAIEIQGDQGPKIKAYLEQKGFNPKLGGGY